MKAFGLQTELTARNKSTDQLHMYQAKSTAFIRRTQHSCDGHGFGHSNGIRFSTDEKTLYVTATDCINGIGIADDTKVSSMVIYPWSTTREAKNIQLVKPEQDATNRFGVLCRMINRLSELAASTQCQL